MLHYVVPKSVNEILGVTILMKTFLAVPSVVDNLSRGKMLKKFEKCFQVIKKFE